MSDLWDKSGLHSAGRDAGTQIVGLMLQAMDEREMDAMKRYILGGLKAVEGEKGGRGADGERLKAKMGQRRLWTLVWRNPGWGCLIFGMVYPG